MTVESPTCPPATIWNGTACTSAETPTVAPASEPEPSGDYRRVATITFDASYQRFSQQANQVDTFGGGAEFTGVGLNNGGVLALELAASGSGGGKGGFDFHIGPGLGVFNEVIALSATVGVGGDSANLGTNAAFYGYAGARLDLNWTEGFRTIGSFHYMLRSAETNEYRTMAGFAFGCFGEGTHPCLEFQTTWILSEYPDVNTSAMGFMVGFGAFNNVL